jgi:AbrB family looped-hinge helix DNA binding protein
LEVPGMSTTPHEIEQEERTERRVYELVVGANGQLVIPVEICDAMGLEPGGTVEIERALVGAWVVPVVTEEEMAAFWGPNWRDELDRSRADVEAGRSTLYDSDEAFLAALDEIADTDVREE